MKTASLLAACTAAILIAGPARAAAPSFVHQGQVTLCTDPTYAPMEFYEHPGDKEPVGFDIDMARALAKRWNAELRIISMEFTGLLPGVQAGRCDFVMSGTFITPERIKNFSGVPYLVSSMVLLVRASTNDVTKPEDLSGKVLAVQAGTQYEKRAHALSDDLVKQGKAPITIQAYPGGSDAIQQLTTGRAAAAITQDTEAAWRAVAQPGEFKIGYMYPATDEFGIYFAKNPANAATVKDDVAALRADGTEKALAAKWHLPAQDAETPLTEPKE
ncbi:MAG TPA: ABC transporter substrate-binding protein [Acetobacteraceae bacterium]|nr:ABC transporter substrate-binding protein [Acetobacteraceae bacterium]